MTTTILLIGADGQVGWELRRTLSTLGQVTTAGRAAADHSLDLTDSKGLDRLVHELRPELIVNAAAYTAVDRAESEPELAWQINADAVGQLGRLGAALDCPVLHYSTDYVFSGVTDRPWKVDDEPAPVSVYGRSKLGGEQALAASGADYLVLRTAWVYGARGGNFLLTMQRLSRERQSLNVVDDQIGAPTWSRQIAEATSQILARCKTPAGRFEIGKRRGLYHLTAAGQASWYEFACAILESMATQCRLGAISTEEYPTPAARPAWSVLDNSFVAERFGVSLPHWREGLTLCLEELEQHG